MAELSNSSYNTLDWFAFETRVRKIISTALHPLAEQIETLDRSQQMTQMRLGNLGESLDDLKEQLQ